MESLKEKLTIKNTVGRTQQMSNDTIESIFQRLPILDLVRIKLLSSYWKSFSDSFLAKNFHKTPFLILPPQQEGEELTNLFTKYSSNVAYGYRLVNLQENIAYPLKKTTSDMFAHTFFGSSYEWLFFSDFMTLTPQLFNPFTEEKIILPSFKSALGITAIELVITKNPNRFRYLRYSKWNETEDTIYPSFVEKAILTANPATTTDYGIVFLCYVRGFYDDVLLYCNKRNDSWESFFTIGDEREVSGLQDITCNQNQIFALRVIDDVKTWIYRWEIRNGNPENMILIQPATMPKTLRLNYEEDYEVEINLDGYDRNYLMELNGEFLLVVRMLRVNMYYELGETSRKFKIFKLDAKKNEWFRSDSVGRNVALFVGRNQSMAISTENFGDSEGNCIYFTQDSRGGTGRDLGVYSMNGDDNEKKIKPILEFTKEGVYIWPQPCWLFPSY